MKCFIFIVFLSFGHYIANSQPQNKNLEKELLDKARLIAIKNFKKTRLFKRDSVFMVAVYDTFYKVAIDTISRGHFKLKPGKAYPEIIAVDILGFSDNKYFLDTAIDLNSQKGIPQRHLVNMGKLFVWWDKHSVLTQETINILDRYHEIVRGKENDWIKMRRTIDDGKKGAQYFFCRTNLSVYRKKITNIGIGGYDPPKFHYR